MVRSWRQSLLSLCRCLFGNSCSDQDDSRGTLISDSQTDSGRLKPNTPSRGQLTLRSDNRHGSSLPMAKFASDWITFSLWTTANTVAAAPCRNPLGIPSSPLHESQGLTCYLGFLPDSTLFFWFRASRYRPDLEAPKSDVCVESLPVSDMIWLAHSPLVISRNRLLLGHESQLVVPRSPFLFQVQSSGKRSSGHAHDRFLLADMGHWTNVLAVLKEQNRALPSSRPPIDGPDGSSLKFPPLWPIPESFVLWIGTNLTFWRGRA